MSTLQCVPPYCCTVEDMKRCRTKQKCPPPPPTLGSQETCFFLRKHFLRWTGCQLFLVISSIKKRSITLRSFDRRISQCVAAYHYKVLPDKMSCLGARPYSRGNHAGKFSPFFVYCGYIALRLCNGTTDDLGWERTRVRFPPDVFGSST